MVPDSRPIPIVILAARVNYAVLGHLGARLAGAITIERAQATGEEMRTVAVPIIATNDTSLNVPTDLHALVANAMIGQMEPPPKVEEIKEEPVRKVSYQEQQRRLPSFLRGKRRG